MITTLDELKPNITDSAFINCDCMEALKNFPDKYFDLAVVDPPYGGAGADVDETFNGAISGRFGGRFEQYFPKDKRGHMCGGHAKKYNYGTWDIAPTADYFDELFRVSKKQIIWGGNYFELPPTRCFLIWKKLTISESFSMAMAEYAWTSFNANAKVFECAPQDTNRFHPTQKPLKLYEWIMQNYAKDGEVILDTHCGSAGSLVAAYRTHHRFVGFEINKDYYTKAKERLEEEMSQMTIFDFMENDNGKDK